MPNRVSGIKYPFLDALRDLARRWRGGDAIVAGDFNTGRIGEDETVKCFNKREDDFMTAMSKAGWADALPQRPRPKTRLYLARAPAVEGASGWTMRSSIAARKTGCLTLASSG